MKMIIFALIKTYNLIYIEATELHHYKIKITLLA